MRDQVFMLHVGNQEVWKALVNDKVIKADFNSKGAALAATKVYKVKRSK